MIFSSPRDACRPSRRRTCRTRTRRRTDRSSTSSGTTTSPSSPTGITELTEGEWRQEREEFEFSRQLYFLFCSSEYRKHYQAMKGDRLPPTWLANFEKVTIDGAKRWAGTFKFYPSLRVPRIRNASVQEAQRQPQLCLQAFFCTMCVNNCISSLRGRRSSFWSPWREVTQNISQSRQQRRT